uniref:Uncharacterized protein n=1 Tax=Setaria viridis TaxID=4556 RepID=A0A4U6WC93_SETVI|nr:hypothetical protein SEVIR_1G181532v2 [Setaria viridis]
MCFRFDLLGCAFLVCRDCFVLPEIIYRSYSPSLVGARS